MADTEHEHCDACGFDAAPYDDAALIAALRALGPTWRRLLADAGTDLRTRPESDVWSAIEYAAHSRDITALHCFGVEQALTGAEPMFPPILADEMIEAAAAAYVADDPVAVADALEADAALLAVLDSVSDEQLGSFHFTMGPMTLDFTTFAGLRLNEHVLHTWDVEVVDDPAAAPFDPLHCLVDPGAALAAGGALAAALMLVEVTDASDGADDVG